MIVLFPADPTRFSTEVQDSVARLANMSTVQTRIKISESGMCVPFSHLRNARMAFSLSTGKPLRL